MGKALPILALSPHRVKPHLPKEKKSTKHCFSWISEADTVSEGIYLSIESYMAAQVKNKGGL